MAIISEFDPSDIREAMTLGVEIKDRVETLIEMVATEDALGAVEVVKDAAVKATEASEPPPE